MHPTPMTTVVIKYLSSMLDIPQDKSDIFYAIKH